VDVQAPRPVVGHRDVRPRADRNVDGSADRPVLTGRSGRADDGVLLLVIGGQLPVDDPEVVVGVDVAAIRLAASLGDERDGRLQTVAAGAGGASGAGPLD